jgi:hypothetical protein
MGTYMYTRNANTLSRRYAYHSCIRKTFWKRFSAFMGDSFNNTQVKTLAKAHYEHFYTSLAKFVTPSPSTPQTIILTGILHQWRHQIPQGILSPAARQETRIAHRSPWQPKNDMAPPRHTKSKRGIEPCGPAGR